MGNLCSVGQHNKMGAPPRSLDELAATCLDWEEAAVATDWVPMRTRLAGGGTTGAWARAFLSAPRMREAGRDLLFLYMVSCSGLTRSVAGGQLEKRLLDEMRRLFFSDSEYWEPAIPLRDIHNNVEHIFRLYYEADMDADNVKKSLRNRLLALRQDETIRSGLEPVFADFLKNRSLHPSHILQQCILSLL